MADLTFDVKIDFGGIGGKKKLTFTSWNGNAPRYDIRDWYDDEKCGKGITLDKDELKALYELLETMYEMPEEVEDEVEEEVIEEENNEEEQMTLFDEASEEVEEEIIEEEIAEDENDYPKTIQKAFKELDELFKDFNVEKAYGKMPFADGERLQYLVHRGDDYPTDYDFILNKLGLKSFITDKGNLYIYTL